MTFLAALRCDRIDAPCVLDQPVNGARFLDYIDKANENKEYSPSYIIIPYKTGYIWSSASSQPCQRAIE
jgi:hypothetical protein